MRRKKYPEHRACGGVPLRVGRHDIHQQPAPLHACHCARAAFLRPVRDGARDRDAAPAADFSAFRRETFRVLTRGVDHQLTARSEENWNALAKRIYACGASAILYLVFQLAALAATAAVYGLEGADCTVYGPLYLCPYGFTYGQYYLLQCAVGLFGTFAFTLLMGALSSLLKSRVSLMAGLGLILATASPFADFFNVEPAFQTLDKIKALMPTQIMGAFNTFQIYQGYEAGGHVIRLPLMTALAAAGWIALCLAVIYRREG